MKNLFEIIKFVLSLYRKYKSPVTVANQLDSVYPIPRPTDTPFLPPYHAIQALISIGTRMFTIGVASCLGVLGWCGAFYFLRLDFFGVAGVVLVFVLLGTVLIAYAEAKQLPLIYERTQQRVSQGTAFWMEPEMMEDSGILFDSDDEGLDAVNHLVANFFRFFGVKMERKAKDKVLPPDEGFLEIGRHGSKTIGLPWNLCSRHLVLFGKTGSGKSKTYFLNMIRRWAGKGSVIALDPKGELMWQTGSSFKKVFRFNLVDPLDSDHWNFIPDCQDSVVAADVTSIMLQLDPTAKKGGGMDPFWENAEALCLWSLLMFLSTRTNPDGSGMIPADISRFISSPDDFATPEQIEEARRIADTSPSKSFNVSLINILLLFVRSGLGKEIKNAWGMFTTIKQEGHANVLLGLGVKVRSFTVPTARDLAQPIGNKDNARWITFKDLRQPGTAIFLIINEGDTGTYQALLATFMGMATQALRKSGMRDDEAKVLCLFDEAGNVPIWGLGEMLGLGRGRKMAVVCCYQTVNQLFKQYGSDGGNAILELFTNYIFLPGATNQTAELATKLLDKVTTWSHTAVDVVGGSGGDNERSSEIGRELMTTGEVRQLVEYRQALAIVATFPPIKMAFPKFAFDPKRPKFEIKTEPRAALPATSISIEEDVYPEQTEVASDAVAQSILPLASVPVATVPLATVPDASVPAVAVSVVTEPPAPVVPVVVPMVPASSSTPVDYFDQLGGKVAASATTLSSDDSSSGSRDRQRGRLIKKTPQYDNIDQEMIDRDPTLL